MQDEIPRLTALARQACSGGDASPANVCLAISRSYEFQHICKSLCDHTVAGASFDLGWSKQSRQDAARLFKTCDWVLAAQAYTKALTWADDGVNTELAYLGRALTLQAQV